MALFTPTSLKKEGVACARSATRELAARRKNSLKGINVGINLVIGVRRGHISYFMRVTDIETTVLRIGEGRKIHNLVWEKLGKKERRGGWLHSIKGSLKP